ncbi:MAG: hypothetical protein WD000_06110 [Thermodesulfobacteriota bacterium]
MNGKSQNPSKLQFPEEAEKIIDSLLEGIRYYTSLAVLGESIGSISDEDFSISNFTSGIRLGGAKKDKLVKLDVPILLARFSLNSIVTLFETHTHSLLMQRKCLEEFLNSDQGVIKPDKFWEIQCNVINIMRGNNSLDEIITKHLILKPSEKLTKNMEWLKGMIRVRNCLSHRLGKVGLEDIKPKGVPRVEVTSDQSLKVKWIRLKAMINGEEIKTFPHKGGGKVSFDKEEYTREWKIREEIKITPAECQLLAMTLSELALQIFSEYKKEILELKEKSK